MLYVYFRKTLGWWLVLSIFAAGVGLTYMRTLDSSPFGYITAKTNATYDYVIGKYVYITMLQCAILIQFKLIFLKQVLRTYLNTLESDSWNQSVLGSYGESCSWPVCDSNPWFRGCEANTLTIRPPLLSIVNWTCNKYPYGKRK